MRSIVLAVAGTLAVVALSELPAAGTFSPAPLGWAAVVLAIPAAAAALRRRGAPAWILLFLAAYAAILVPLGARRWVAEDAGSDSVPTFTLAGLLAVAAPLATWTAFWRFRALPREPARFFAWFAPWARIAAVSSAVLLLMVGTFDAAQASGAERFFADPQVALPAAIAALQVPAVFFLLPYLLPLAVSVTPVPCDALRRRLEDHARAQAVRLRAIVTPRAGTEHTLNAAALGVVQRSFLIVLTRGALRVLPPRDLEAVFCHELGHVHKRHAVYHALLAVASLLAAAAVLRPLETLSPWVLAAVLALGAWILWGVFFPRVSRNFELEADAAAAAMVGAGAYGDAIEKIIQLLGPGASRGGWRHFSLQVRFASLSAVRRDPRAASSLARRCRRLRRTILAFFIAAAAVFCWTQLAALRGDAPATAPHSERTSFDSSAFEEPAASSSRNVFPEAPSGRWKVSLYFMTDVVLSGMSLGGPSGTTRRGSSSESSRTETRGDPSSLVIV